MKLFRASQSSVVHIKAVLTPNQSPVWTVKLFQRFIDTVVCKLCLSQSFRHQSTSCAKNHTKAVLCSDVSIVSCRTTLWGVATNFSCLFQIRREKFCFASNVSIFLLYFFCVTASMPRLANFSPCDPLVFFLFSPTLYTHSLLKNEFFRMFMGNYREKNREWEMFRLHRFPITEAKSYFFALFCALNQTFFFFFAVPAGHRWEKWKKKTSD